MRVYSTTVKYGYSILYFGNNLRSIKKGFGQFFKLKESFKDSFDMCSIRVFSKFSLNPFYEPLPWFMIVINDVPRVRHLVETRRYIRQLIYDLQTCVI